MSIRPYHSQMAHAKELVPMLPHSAFGPRIATTFFAAWISKVGPADHDIRIDNLLMGLVSHWG